MPLPKQAELDEFEPTLDAAIKAVNAGLFEAQDYGVYSFMKNGGCSLAPLGTFDAKVPDDVKAKIAENIRFRSARVMQRPSCHNPTRRRVDFCPAPKDTAPVSPDRREVLIWAGGALLILALVAAWLWWTAPEQDLLPSQYNYGVL